MISVILIAAAVAVAMGLDAAKLRAVADKAREKVSPKAAVVAALVLLAVLLIPRGRQEAPEPPDDGPLSLEGMFVGPTASSDAATIGALLSELADEIEYDGSQPEPMYQNGVQIDQLRKAARVLRCRGESIGDRQPKARDAIASYLEIHVGTDGGKLTPESRSAWVSAFRDVGRAATDAAQ